MQKTIVFLFAFLFWFKSFGQETIILPEDFRQHSLTQFNSSLSNATYALDWNNPRSLSLWTRWQWQTIDGDPTTLFVNYSHTLNPKTSVGLGFLQNNSGTFLNKGGVLNFAQSITVQPNVNLIVGANIYLFTQELADDRFNPDMDVSQLESTNDFIAQFSPGIRFNINQFSIAASLENIVDYNFTNSETNNNSNIFFGSISNDFPIALFPSIKNGILRTVIYLRSFSSFEAQYGGNLLLSTSKFWVQGGYNNFYGPSGGAGVTLFNTLSIGGVIEFEEGGFPDNENPTFELIASYHFGKADIRKRIVGFEAEEIQKEELEEKKEQKVKLKKDTKKKKSRKEIKAEEKERQRKFLEQEKMKRMMDSLAVVKEKKAAILRDRNRLDSIARIEQTKEVEVLPNEKYEEVASTAIEGLEPGFYLIANVFGTKKYFEAFMKSTRAKGLNPNSFYRSKNKYNYVYLGKYNTIEEARKARNSKLNGSYSGKTWIFRVKK